VPSHGQDFGGQPHVLCANKHNVSLCIHRPQASAGDPRPEAAPQPSPSRSGATPPPGPDPPPGPHFHDPPPPPPTDLGEGWRDDAALSLDLGVLHVSPVVQVSSLHGCRAMQGRAMAILARERV
jgi:hypothetical protein